MAKANFFLKEPKSQDETLVYLFFSYNNRRFKYSTGERIKPSFWNPEEQRARETKKFVEYPEFNSRLDNVITEVNNIYRKLINDKITPTNEILRENLNNALNEVLGDISRLDLFSFIDKFIEEGKAVKAKGTISSYTDTLRILKLYCKHKRKKIDFDDIDLDFYNSYLNYLTSNLKFSLNTIGKHIKNIKVFLNEATERGINTKLDFKKRKFKKLTEDTEKIYLSSAELDIIYALDLTTNEELEKARDLFIVGCYTGLRFSDFTQLRKENIIDGNKLKIRTQKTNETVMIPIHKYVREVFSKHNGELPSQINNQKMNDYLKDIGKIAEINEPVEMTFTKGGEVKKDIFKKYELITSHVARRSFATNLYLVDVPSITIMKITGHKTEKSFLRYIRITQEENANKLLNHPFFNNHKMVLCNKA
jgi:integrase